MIGCIIIIITFTYIIIYCSLPLINPCWHGPPLVPTMSSIPRYKVTQLDRIINERTGGQRQWGKLKEILGKEKEAVRVCGANRVALHRKEGDENGSTDRR